MRKNKLSNSIAALKIIRISFFDFSETGQIGDTIGGITAPFIGFIAGYLTFLAFHEQYRANDEAKKNYLKERFESKFYSFLSLLNTLEINTKIPQVGNYKQAFHFMFYEYKAIAVLTSLPSSIRRNLLLKRCNYEILALIILFSFGEKYFSFGESRFTLGVFGILRFTICPIAQPYSPIAQPYSPITQHYCAILVPY